MGKLRRFYTFFALKEAYVKMTGEALLAGWLRDVEFRNVVVPGPGERSESLRKLEDSEATAGGGGRDGEANWGNNIQRETEVWIYGKQQKGVKMGLRGWGMGFLVAVAIDGEIHEECDGKGEEKGKGAGWRFLDWKKDISDCAEGRCLCLDQEVHDSDVGMYLSVGSAIF